MQDSQFINKSKFTQLIEKVVHKHKSSYMDAIIHICDEEGIDLEDVRKYITPTIKDKLEAEAMRLNFLPRANTLPID